MQTQIIQTHAGQLKIGTWDLSQGIGIEHRVIKQIAERNKKYIGNVIAQKKQIPNKIGRRIEEYLLDESQTRVVLALLHNHPKMTLGLHACTFQSFDSEIHFFKTLENILKKIQSCAMDAGLI